MKFGVEIPQTQMDVVESRAHRLAVSIDRATVASNDKRIRETGGQLVDRILEWVEEIKDLREVGDEEVIERLQSFRARLSLAERAVASWPQAARSSRPAASRPRRRARKERHAA